MRIVGLILVALATASVEAADGPGVRITGEAKYPPHSLVRLKAEGVDPKAAVLWRVHPAKGVQKATTPRGVLEFAAHPGTYEVELLVIRQTDDGLVVEIAIATERRQWMASHPILPALTPGRTARSA